MLNNFDIIADMLKFDSDDDFYFMQIIRRRKENPDMTKNSVALKSYTIRSVDQLRSYWDDIVGLCNHFNARATIRVNRRSYKICLLETMDECLDCIKVDDYRSVSKLYDKAMGKNHSDPVKKWLLDVDDIPADDPRIQEIIDFLAIIRPEGDKLVKIIPSKTGCHLITTGFDPRNFKDKYPEIEIIKDSPTNIYIP